MNSEKTEGNSEIRRLKYWINGKWETSKTEKYMDCYNPSTGEVMARAPQCTAEEVEAAVASAATAYPAWSNTPPNKREIGRASCRERVYHPV